jgi:uncharacterized protein YkwD
VNQHRQDANLPPLAKNDALTAAAKIRAKEINTSFSHTRPDGRGFTTVLHDLGIKYSSAAENIAIGYTTPELVVADWMKSDGHRRNIMNPGLTKIGVGVEPGVRHGYAWTQLFTRD